MEQNGKLYIVPTPIGNLEDMTFRAIRVLKEASFILAEDTRVSGKLLQHYDIASPMMSHHKFNEHHTVERVISKLRSGEVAALISDAGTPAISDPGFLLVRECIAHGVTIECLPGATALVPALVNSGLPNDKFCFEGFLPQKKGRQKAINALEFETRTMVFYESPYRLVKSLKQLADLMGEERRCSVSRELSKFYEETVRGTLLSVAEHFTNKPPKGEIVMVVEGRK